MTLLEHFVPVVQAHQVKGSIIPFNQVIVNGMKA